MAKQPEPWRRKDSKGAWYTTINKVQTFLAPPDATKAEAWEELRRILGPKSKRTARVKDSLTVADVINLFLSVTAKAVERGEKAPVTLEGYERHLQSALRKLGPIRAADLLPLNVEKWVQADPPGWGPTTRFNAITAIKRCFRWARRSGHLEDNPIADLERPTPRRRERILTNSQLWEILDAIRDQEFRDLVTALRETGCRPGEVCRLTAAAVDLKRGTWTVSNKTEHATGERTRTVYLTPAVVVLTRRLVALYPTGPLFRNIRGAAWTRHTIAHRMGRLAKRLGYGPEAVVYTLRHLYITDALEKGIPPATVAELVGHKDVTMIMRVYNQLKSRTDHLHNAAREIRP